jgi:hypothetical protein
MPSVDVMENQPIPGFAYPTDWLALVSPDQGLTVALDLDRWRASRSRGFARLVHQTRTAARGVDPAAQSERSV